MPKGQVRGFQVNYRQAGQGEDVILIHGLAANHAFWNLALMLPLARKYRLTVYDLRGHGYSGMPARGYTSADMAEDLFALMDYLGIERAHIVGHSFGGVVALHSAVSRPARVVSLTIADARIRALQPRHRLRDWSDWRRVQAALAEQGISIDENQEDVGVALLEKLAAPEWRASRRDTVAKTLFLPFGGWQRGDRSAKRWLKLLNSSTARRDIVSVAGLTLDRIKRVRQPTLAMYGQRSRCLKTCQQLQVVLADCRTVLVPKGGHFFPMTRPAFVSEKLLEFLQKAPRRQPSAPFAPAKLQPTRLAEPPATRRSYLASSPDAPEAETLPKVDMP